MRRAARGEMIGRLTQFWSVVRELDLGSLRADFERAPRLALYGSEGSGRHTLARSLFGVEIEALGGRVLGLETPDAAAEVALLVVDGSVEPDIATRHAAQDLAAGCPLLVVLTHADEVPDAALREERRIALTVGAGVSGVCVDARDAEAARQRVAPELFRLAPRLRLAVGRRAPALRARVARELIQETSRVNAEFALLTNLPAAIPLAGGIVGDAADMLVLTKNQALLVFKLAGLYGRDLHHLTALGAEIAPVVGGGFAWRSLARSVAGLLPPWVGAVPKTLIAYVGTFVVGETARFYYEHGAAPPPAVVARFRSEGARMYQQVAGRLGRSPRAGRDGA